MSGEEGIFGDVGPDVDRPEPMDEMRERAIAALLTQPTVLKAAQSIGVGERTLHRWMREPRFLAELRRARAQAFADAVGLTQRFASGAVQVLASIMADKNAPHTARIAAAGMLLKFGRESVEIDAAAAAAESIDQHGLDGATRRLPSPGVPDRVHSPHEPES